MELTQYQVRRMQELSDRFFLIQESPEMVNVCFWYIPERLRETPHDEQRISELGRVTAELKTRMMYSGNLMVGYQPLDDKPNFFRSIISNQGKAMMVLNNIFKYLIFDIKPARRRTLTSCWRSSTDSALICKIFLNSSLTRVYSVLQSHCKYCKANILFLILYFIIYIYNTTS